MKKGILLLALVLVSCSPESVKITSEEFNTSKIAYFQDTRTGLCFATLGYKRVDTSGRAAYGMSFTEVPCNPEVLSSIVKRG